MYESHDDSSFGSYDDYHDYEQPSKVERQEDEGYNTTSSYTTTTSTLSSYPSPKEVIYANGSFDDTEDRIYNMLDSMSNIQARLAIKGKKVAMERRMEKMMMRTSDDD
jgi:hypothetical protein